MSITICDTHLARTVRYLSLTFEPVYSKMTLDWLVYVLGVVAVVFLVGMFFKYKKHNRYADKFEDTYPDAK